MEVLKSGKLNLVDFLLFSGQGDKLAGACRVQLVAKSKLPISVKRKGILAAAGKRRGVLGRLTGKRPFKSFIKYKNKGESPPDGLNFYERAVFEGADDRWFPAHYGALIAAYNRMGLMKEGQVGCRGEELRGMYKAAIDKLVFSLKQGSTEERAALLNEYSAWFFAFFALPLPKLEPKELKVHIRQRNAEHRDPVIDDKALLEMLNDDALHALAAAETESG